MSCGPLMIRGHAIEVRLYAEDAANGFLPSIGPLSMFRPPEGPGIRLDTGVREGDEVTPNYDPMLAKLIVWAPSRDEALQKMRRALDEFVVLGTTTNIEFLRDLCDARPVVDGSPPPPPSTTSGLMDGILQRHRCWKKPPCWQRPVQKTLGLHRRTTAGSSVGSTGPASPFTTIQRRFP